MIPLRDLVIQFCTFCATSISFWNTLFFLQFFILRVAWSRFFDQSLMWVQNDFWRLWNKKFNIWEVKTSKSDLSFSNAFFFCHFPSIFYFCVSHNLLHTTYYPNFIQQFWCLHRAITMVFDASETVLNKKFNVWVVKLSQVTFHFSELFLSFTFYFSFFRVARSKFFTIAFP